MNKAQINKLFYFDSFSGLIPCVKIGINKFKLTSGRFYGYKRGEILDLTENKNAIPRNWVFVRGGQYRILWGGK